MERVDAAIAGDEDLAAEPLGEEIGPGRAGRREMQVGDERDRAPVDLLGEGRGRAIGAQPRLDMGDRDAAVERGQRGGERGAGVALDDHPVGRGLGEDRVEPLDRRAASGVERLARAPSGRDRNPGGSRRNRAPDRADARCWPVTQTCDSKSGSRVEREQDRRQLDGFGPRAENRQQLHAAPPALQAQISTESPLSNSRNPDLSLVGASARAARVGPAGQIGGAAGAKRGRVVRAQRISGAQPADEGRRIRLLAGGAADGGDLGEVERVAARGAARLPAGAARRAAARVRGWSASARACRSSAFRSIMGRTLEPARSARQDDDHVSSPREKLPWDEELYGRW